MSKRPDRDEIEQLDRLRAELRQRVMRRAETTRRKTAPMAIANGWKLEAERKKQDAIKALAVVARSRTTHWVGALAGAGALSALLFAARRKFGHRVKTSRARKHGET